jgi:demethylmenaquinone methyltransferase/2-methoxy-6-polyprenyl-1,4-benzoquinol methylase
MNDWRTYDEVAETYERVHAPRFAEVARDLLAMAAPSQGGLVLDVGTGTGVAAQAALEAGHPVAGIDESVRMLTVGRRARPRLPLVAAEAIDLPFADGTFAAALGAFVLAHFTKYQTALYDIARVLRPGGRMAFASWSDGLDAYQLAWRELVESVVPREMLEPAYAEAAPWHEKFRDREATEEVLIDAGLRHVRTELRKYHWTYPREDYLDGLEVWAVGRFVREMLGPTDWAAFRARASALFAERFPDPLNDFREVILAVATKP